MSIIEKSSQSIHTWTGMRINKNDLVSSYVIFDLETTGFDAYNDFIIEIGALKYVDNQLVDSLQILIDPKIPIPKVITDLTGITDEMVKGQNSIEQGIESFLAFIGDYPLIAHNGSFDLGFINANLDNLNIDRLTNKNIDTLALSRRYLPFLPNHKLPTLKQHFNLNYGSHRSLEDCMVTNYVYQYCLNESKKVS